MPWRILSNALGRPHPETGSGCSTIGSVLSSIWSAVTGSTRKSQCSAAFTASVIALAAKLSKADGVVLQMEKDAFKQIFHVPESEAANADRLFDLATQDVAGFEAYARDIASELENEPDLKRDVFDALLHIASADGVLHEAEDDYLRRVAELFGYSDPEYRALRARFVYDSNDPYVVLGLPHDLSDSELKVRYRQLVKDNHPDAMMAHGVPAEHRAIAERKLAAINAAWDEIARERGI